MTDVLKNNKRNKDLLCAIQALFDEGYWRCEFERNEQALRRIFISNNVTVIESVWCNNYMLSLVEAASLPSVKTGTLSTGGNRKEMKPLIQFPPSHNQILAIQHELDQPPNGLTNREIMSAQFAERLYIQLASSKMAENPLGLISEKIEKFYLQDLYTPKDIIEFLKHFYFNKSIHTLSLLQLVTDLTESEFHVSRDDLDSQNAMEEKIMKWIDRAADHEITISKQNNLCKLLIKSFVHK
jgi:hypothetical protein